MIDIAASSIGRVALIEIKGRIDSMNAPELDELLMRVADNDYPQLVLDMQDVTYMSAAGLRVLRNIYERVGKIHISRPSQRVREVLQITGLDSTYQMFEQRVEAIHTHTPITNAHTHLEGGWLATYCPKVEGAPFVDWILGLIQRTIALGERRNAVVTKAIETGIQELLDAGTTVVGDISGTGLSIEPLLASGLGGVVYLEVLGSNLDVAVQMFSAAQTLIEKWRPKERNGMRLGITMHTPYSVYPDIWKTALDYVRKEALPLCIHVAESPHEREFLLTGESAEMDKFYARPGAVKIPAPMKTPVRYLEDLGALDLKPLLVHAVEVDDDDIQRIKASGSAVVHCPRSNLRLRCNRMPLEKFIAQGIPVYLGTDGLSSAPSLNVFDELEFATALHHGKVAPDAIEKFVYQPLPMPS